MGGGLRVPDAAARASRRTRRGRSAAGGMRLVLLAPYGDRRGRHVREGSRRARGRRAGGRRRRVGVQVAYQRGGRVGALDDGAGGWAALTTARWGRGRAACATPPRRPPRPAATAARDGGRGHQLRYRHGRPRRAPRMPAAPPPRAQRRRRRRAACSSPPRLPPRSAAATAGDEVRRSKRRHGDRRGRRGCEADQERRVELQEARKDEGRLEDGNDCTEPQRATCAHRKRRRCGGRRKTRLEAAKSAWTKGSRRRKKKESHPE